LLACVTRANVGDLEATPDASSNDAAPAIDGARSDASSASDVSTPTIDAGCNVGFPQEGSVVDIAVINGAPPFLNGGGIVLGTYELTAIRVFAGGTTGTARVRETIVVRGGATAGAIDRLTETTSATGSFKNVPLHGETVTWEAPSGPVFFQTNECPKKEPERTGTFEANGTTLRIFDDQSVIEREYRRIR